eukprot:4467651-Prorocentrum_lima.AAC.1
MCIRDRACTVPPGSMAISRRPATQWLGIRTAIDLGAISRFSNRREPASDVVWPLPSHTSDHCIMALPLSGPAGLILL